MLKIGINDQNANVTMTDGRTTESEDRFCDAEFAIAKSMVKNGLDTLSAQKSV